jgi:hypothetical protein
MQFTIKVYVTVEAEDLDAAEVMRDELEDEIEDIGEHVVSATAENPIQDEEEV